MGTPALLIIDMVNRFDFEGGDALAAAALELVPEILRLRRSFDRAGHPVIYANDNFTDWKGGFPHLVASCQAQGGASGAIASSLAPAPGHFHLLKPKHSAFLGTPLQILLAQLAVDRLVLTGIATDSCILATAQDAHMRDYALAIPSDATAALTPRRRRQALDLARGALGASTAKARSVARARR